MSIYKYLEMTETMSSRKIMGVSKYLLISQLSFIITSKLGTLLKRSNFLLSFIFDKQII